MDEDLQNIEDLFKAALDDNEDMPSKKVWDGIDTRLDKENIIAIKKKYNTVKRIAFLLLLLVLGFSLYELNNHSTKNDLADKNNTDKNKNAENNDAVKELNNIENVTNSKNNLTRNIAVAKEGIPNETTVPATDNSISGTKINAVTDYPGFNQPQLLTDKSVTAIKIKNGRADKEETAIVENNETEINKLPSALSQLEPIAFEKINLQKINPLSIKEIIYHSITDKILFTADGNSSKTKNTNTKPSRLSVTAFFAPESAWYRLKEDKPGNQPDNITKIEKGEHHESSSTTGVLVDYNLNKHFALQTGLMFSNSNLIVNPKTIYAQADNSGNVKYRLNFSSGYGYLIPSFQPNPAVGDSLNVTGTTHKLRYIGIPVAVKYRIVKGKFIIEAMAGISTNFLTTGKLETEIQNGSNNEIDILNKIEGLKPVYFSGLAGIGVTYKLTNKFSFVLMPTARFALNAINKDAVVKTFPNAVGLSAGLKIKF